MGCQKKLIRHQQIASAINVGYRLYDKSNTLFTVSFIPAKGVDKQILIDAIKTQVKKLIEHPKLIKDELCVPRLSWRQVLSLSKTLFIHMLII